MEGKLNMNRRTFLSQSALCLIGWSTGCSRTSAPKSKLEFWSARDGSTQHSLDLFLPPGRWKNLAPPPFGFLLNDGHRVLALDFSGQSQVYENASGALWIRPDRLLLSHNPSSEVCRLSLRPFPGDRLVWQRDFEAGNVLGANQQSLFLQHQGGVSCLSLETAQENWSNGDLIDIKSSYLEPNCLVLGLGNEGEVCWVDLSTGQPQRSLLTTRGEPNRVILVVGDGQTTMVLTRRSWLSAYHHQSSRPVWRQALGPEAHRTELLGFQNQVAVIELNHASQAFDLRNGKKLWSDVLCRDLSICAETVLMRRPPSLGQPQGQLQLLALELRSGRPLWARPLSDLRAATNVNKQTFAVLSLGKG